MKFGKKTKPQYVDSGTLKMTCLIAFGMEVIYTKNLGIPILVWRMTSVVDSGVNKHQDVESVIQILSYDMVFRIEERLKCGI